MNNPNEKVEWLGLPFEDEDARREAENELYQKTSEADANTTRLLPRPPLGRVTLEAIRGENDD